MTSDPGIDVAFTSDASCPPRAVLMALLDQAAASADAGLVSELCLHLFSLTDPALVARLADLAGAGVRLRLLLDWCQGGSGSNRAAPALANLPGVAVRFQLDWPYRWTGDRLKWHYPDSLGLCHHKNILLLVAGQPVALATGSYNWTLRAAAGYEQLLLLRPVTPATAMLIWRCHAEFAAAWNDPGSSVDAATARQLYGQGCRLGDRHGELRQALLAGRLGLPAPAEPVLPLPLPDAMAPPPTGTATARIEVAFSGGPLAQRAARCGFAAANAGRGFDLAKPSGRVRRVKLTLEVLMLEAIHRARAGDVLRVAMFALSQRGPEFGALLDAARRGVEIRLLLDRRASAAIADRLAQADGVPISIGIPHRFMHQKYAVLERGGVVVVGTANATPDASQRHVESRILFDGAPALAAAFIADFERIRARLPSQNGPQKPRGGTPGAPPL